MSVAKLRLAPAALSDLQEIKSYICNELCNPSAADRIIRMIVDNYSMLESSPFIGASLSSIIPIETDFRYLVCENYIVFYKAEGAYVSVYRVLYGRRNYIKILFGEVSVEEEL